jgi:hypothetical protein
LKSGDWIQSKLSLYTVYGYLLEVGEPHKVLQVYRVYNTGVKEFYNPFRETTFYNVEPVDAAIHPDDLQELVSMALDTKDEKWFRELTGRERV